MPILGTIASSTRQGLATNSYESIATATVGAGGTTSITFNSIPQTYTHLQVRGICLTDTTANSVDVWVRFNGDSGTNYAEHYITGNGTSIGSGGGFNLNQASQFYAYNTTGTVEMAPGVFDYLDYTSTSKFKTLRGYTGQSNANLVVARSSLWRSTSAITSITFGCSGTIKQNSQIAIYGIRST